MTLILNNDDVKSVLNMEVTMKALEEAYQELARSEAVCRPRIDVQIPTKDHREEYAKEISEEFEIEVVPLENPRDVYRGADIVAGCTDSAVPIIAGRWLEAGTHVTCIGGKPDDETFRRIDVSLRLGTAPALRSAYSL